MKHRNQRRCGMCLVSDDLVFYKHRIFCLKCREVRRESNSDFTTSTFLVIPVGLVLWSIAGCFVVTPLLSPFFAIGFMCKEYGWNKVRWSLCTLLTTVLLIAVIGFRDQLVRFL